MWLIDKLLRRKSYPTQVYHRGELISADAIDIVKTKTANGRTIMTIYDRSKR